MSYEVTATRRRPQRFDDLAGQEFVAETLRNAIQSQKIAHAYLFSGPRGCGKTSTARILSKALNCAHGPTATPCGECQQCKEITKGACTDVIEIDGASNTSVNDVRQIKDEVLFPPQSCRYKIYIIDEVHMLSTSAFNALLKTIEEPPPYVIFIFATTELQKVPATIKSRCQQFNFRLVPVERVKELLREACKDINIEAEDEALYWIARESTGSVRDSYTLFDQVAAFSGDKITYEKIRDKLGLVGVDRLNAIFDDCAANRTQDALTKLDGFLQSGISIEQLISNATDYLRSLLLIKNGITKEALLGQASERYSSTVLESWNSVQIERGLSLLLQLYRDIRYSLNPRYELELAFSRLSWLSQYVSPAEVKAAIDSAHALLSTAPKQPAKQSAVPQMPSPQAQPAFAPAAAQVQNKQVAAPPSGAPHGGLPMFSALANTSQVPPQKEPTPPFHNGGPVAATVPPQNPAAPESTPPAPTAQPAPQAQLQQQPANSAPSAQPDIAPQMQPQSASHAPATQPAPQAQVQQPANSAPTAQPGIAPQMQPQSASPAPTAQPAPQAQVQQQPANSAQTAQPSMTPQMQPQCAFPAPAAQPAPQAQVQQQPASSAPSAQLGSAPQMQPQSASPAPAAQPAPQTALTAAQLRDQLIARLTTEDTILAASLMRTGEWRRNGSSIIAQTDSIFLKSQLSLQTARLTSALCELSGEALTFTIDVKQASQANAPRQYPPEVQLLCSAFKGAVVGVAERSPQSKKPQNAPAMQQAAIADDEPTEDSMTFDDSEDSD